jgi:NADH-quinone oxidoreductase subunit L
MFPLHGWLPDAMEGPTPVSSLIHSATMVVAGVYLTARLFPLFAASGSTLKVVEITGGFTAVFAAVIACTQMDLKRILAFSTLSQLGLMMASLGAGAPADAGAGHALPFVLAYSASMFHVFTHAFFKCLLFLSAGVVIHAIHSNDIRDAGGLRKVLPFTYGATLIAVLAIAGIPPFAGFFSKDAILSAAFGNGHYIGFASTLLTGGLTAFYMSRYLLLAFHGVSGSARPAGFSGVTAGHGNAAGVDAGGAVAVGAHASVGHTAPHEAWVMVLPIVILALPSAVIGWLTKDFFMAHVIPGALSGAAEANAATAPEGGPAWLPWLASALAATGVLIGWLLYGRKNRKAGYPEGAEPAWYRLIRNKFYIDDLYLFLARKAVNRGVAAPAQWTERKLINGSFDVGAGFIRRLAAGQSRFQNGQVQRYIAVALLGLILLCILGRTVP